MYSVYVLRCADGSYYTGIAQDVARRIEEHNGSSKGAKYTRSRRPAILVYQEDGLEKGEALRRERVIKKLSRAQKEALFSQVGV